MAQRQGDRYDSKKITAICDRGLKKAPSSDKHYKVGLSLEALMILMVLTPYWQILKRLRQELMNKIEVTHRTDPLTVFPAEIMEMILSHLEFKEIALVDTEYLVLGATDVVPKDMCRDFKGLESLLDIRPALLEKARLLWLHISKTDANSRQLCQELRQVVSESA